MFAGGGGEEPGVWDGGSMRGTPRVLAPCFTSISRGFFTLLFTRGVKNDVKAGVKNGVKMGVNDEAGVRAIAGESAVPVRSRAVSTPSFFRMAPFRVLEAARAVVDEVNTLLGNRKLRLMHRAQLRDSAQSIPANIREGMGRQPGPRRHQAYRVARGSAEEADEHLRANFADGRIPAAAYWRIHNRIGLVVKILTTIVDAE